MRARRVDVARLAEFAGALMRAKGVDEAQITTVVPNLMWCELAGRANFGIERLPILLERVERGVINCPCTPHFDQLSESVARLDGDRGFGHHAAELAMRRAIDMAKATGIGAVGVRNSNFFGAGAYYVKLAAEASMIGLALSNSFPKVAPHGGIRAALGTNPFAFGAPRQNGDHLLFDMATSGLAGSTVRELIAAGKPLPTGLAIDAEGRPITDPHKVNEGALLPFGGAKGYGLALMVEVLAGVLTGAGVAEGVASMYGDFSRSGDNGHFLMAIDVSRWMAIDDYYARFEGLVHTLKASGGEVLLPGEVRWQTYRGNLTNGIPIDPATAKAVEPTASSSNIVPPWAEILG
jgi:LDH2 family malate/lactate/ureidoglycolate dehydrogenase